MCERNRDEILVHNITKQQNQSNAEHNVRSYIVQGMQISVHLVMSQQHNYNWDDGSWNW
jgi:hypothetical protein